jgi:Asp-tRNA(Asn)/Glu-tRNA(Gln) amidotransferase C subunit
MNQINVDVSFGEFIDKLTILEVKLKNVKDPSKLEHINKEISILQSKLEERKEFFSQIEEEKNKLFILNLTLWNIEDELRILEHKNQFDDNFTQLARCVYLYNDKRNFLKNQINTKLGCNFLEIKDYSNKEILKEKKKVILIPNLGTGDILISSSLVRFYNFDHDVVLLVPKNAQETLKNLFKGTTVQFEYIEKGTFQSEANQIINIIKKYNSFEIKGLGCNRCIFNEKDNYDKVDIFWKAFYLNCNLPHQIANLGFYFERDDKEEENVYQSFLEKYNITKEDQYIIINDDESRDFTINLNKVNINYHIIHLDKKKCGLFYTNLFHYLKLLENAKEYHSFDTSFTWLVYYTKIQKNIYLHTYVRDKELYEKDYFNESWGINLIN